MNRYDAANAREGHTMNSTQEEKIALFRKWSFPWPIIQVLTGKASAIDMKKLSVEGLEDAEKFILAYGFDAQNQKDQRLIHAILIEAIFFIQKYLMPTEWKQGICPPKEILLCQDGRELLVWASKNRKKENTHTQFCQIWACAILRVMHTIVHIDGLQRMSILQSAHEKLHARFDPYLWKDENNRLFLGSRTEYLEIEGFRWKSAKSRESIILKLLHKPANVAETIYDLTGLRIVTKRVSDVMIVLKYLRTFNLVSFASVNPARVRNNLIDVDLFHSHSDVLKQMLVEDKIDRESFETRIDQVERVELKNNTQNPYSSDSYRSLQLTGRLRVQRVDSFSRFLDRLTTILATCPSHLKPVLQGILQYGREHLVGREKEQSAFFPYEIQVMDKESAMQLVEGEASHFRYKRAQLKAARRRTLGDLFMRIKT